MCLMSAPAAKNPSTAEQITSVPAPVRTTASAAASRPSSRAGPTGFAGGRQSRASTNESRIAISTAGWDAGSTAMPHHRPGGGEMAAEWPPQHASQVARDAQQRVQVDAGRDAHLLEHRDQV